VNLKCYREPSRWRLLFLLVAIPLALVLGYLSSEMEPRL
jgi:hypothetical protein